MAGVGELAGKIDPRESRIIRNLFRLDSLTAKDIMTPRTVISGLPQEMTVAAALALKPGVSFSRLPIFEADLDHICGFILKSDLLLASAGGHGKDKLISLKRELNTVPGSLPLSELLEFLLDQRQQMALVIDEYGGTRGLVTIEDVIETLLGMEIVDEMDRVEDMQALARRQWEKRAKSMGIAPQTEKTGLQASSQDG